MKRETKAEAESRLAQLGRKERDAFFARPRSQGLLSNNMTDGLFQWNTNGVTFKFHGAGKLRTITIPQRVMDDVFNYAEQARAVGDIGIGELLVPSAGDRWQAELSQTVGSAHNLANTTMWERAAWNTVNEWCMPRYIKRGEIAIEYIKELSEICYGRYTGSAAVWYLLPPSVAQSGDDVPPSGNSVYGVNVLTKQAMWSKPTWYHMTNPEFVAYVQVAWDTYQSTGQPAQLNGF